MELLSCGDQRLSPLPTKYPCLVAHTLEAEEDDQDPLAQHPCRIPELHGRRFEGCFHGWVVLSDFPQRRTWSIWNPFTSKIISLPDLILENRNYKYLGQCCLTSAPDHPGSLLMLPRCDQPIILFCRLDGKPDDGKVESLRWTKILYAKEIKSVTGECGCVISSLTSCNGKVYALNSGRHNNLVINLKLTVRDRVEIKLLPYAELPDSSFHGGYCSSSSLTPHLIGSSSELFYMLYGFDDKVAKQSSLSVYLFKLETTSMIWKEVEDLKDAIFFLDSSYDHSVFYKPGIASEFGGYIHILGEMGKVMYSYHIKDKTVSISSMPSVASAGCVSLWECRRIQNKDKTVVGNACSNDNSSISTRNERPEESCLLNIPSEILERIMDFCVGFDYLNFRTACKSCQIAAPMIPFINRMRLGKTSFDTPWLLVLDKNREIITFTDPMFGENYSIKTPPGLIGVMKIHCSRYGWLLMEKYGGLLVFYNPFTSVIHELLHVPYRELETLYFPGPPASPNWMVVGYRKLQTNWKGYVHYVGRQPARWIEISMNYGLFDQERLCYSKFHGRCLFVSLDDGGVYYFKLAKGRSSCSAISLPRRPISCESLPQKFIVEQDQHLLLVIVGGFGESIEVFKLNDSTEKWEKIDSLGRHMIYICGRTCLCIEAKTREMENKIYFPRLRSGNGRIVFYSLETQKCHTFNGRDIAENFGDFFGTKHLLNPHAWIEPSWL